MADEILTPAEMGEADRLTIAAGPEDGYALMLNAGTAVASHLLAHHGDATEFHILCGPGNNGGNGYVVARICRKRRKRACLVRRFPEGRHGRGAGTAGLPRSSARHR